MNYYCNYSIKGCNEKELKGLHFKKNNDYYEISNGIGMKENEFSNILKMFKNYKLMVFISRPYDSFIDLGISDIGSSVINEQKQICYFDYSEEELFINKCYPTDSFTFSQIDNQTGDMLSLEYKNPYLSWWNGEDSYSKSFDKEAIKIDDNCNCETMLGLHLKSSIEGKKINENDFIKLLKGKKVSLEDATEQMKDSDEIVEIAVKNDASQLKYASDRLKNNKEFITKIIKKVKKNSNLDYLKIFSNIGKELKNDKSFFIPFIKEDQYPLRYIGQSLKNDVDFLLINFNGINYASTNIKNKLNNDREFALSLTKKGGIYAELPDKFKDEREFALEAVKSNIGNYHILPNKFKEDKEIALIALRKNKYVTRPFIPKKLRSDDEIKKYLQ